MQESNKSDINSVVRQGLHRSIISLIIKLSTAGLTYLMFVMLARAMHETEYGLFAIGFSLATILAIAASFGQQTAILRYWPEDEGRGDSAGARSSLRAGWALTLGIGVLISLTVALFAWLYGTFSSGLESVLHILAATLLILPLATAEYGSSALRAQGSVLTALLPRDLLWRALMPLLALWALVTGYDLSGVQALLIAGSTLAGLMFLQFFYARIRGYYNAVKLSDVRNYWQKRGEASRWFFMGTVADTAALNIDIVLVGLFIAAQSAGLYFNAFRTAGLMTLFLFAIIQVIAPMLAKHYHGGEMRKAQAVTSFCAWAGFLFSLVVFGLYVLFGDQILLLFGEEFTNGKIILVILSFGLLFDAATGPTRIVFNMTGFERSYVKLFGGVMILGFCVQLVVIPYFGLVAAAVVNAVARIISQIVLVIWARRHVGIDPSIWGVFLLRKVAKQPIG